MGIIDQAVRIGDIANAEAFVQRAIDKSGVSPGPHEREELLAEGMTILLELYKRYKPGIGGRDASKSTFSGYASMFLPRRLGDAWHKWHPEHRYVTDPVTGKRGWTYGRPMLSLDGLGESSGLAAGDREAHLVNAKTINGFCHATIAKLALSRIATSSLAR